jgi:type VI secretion system protein ImpM
MSKGSVGFYGKLPVVGDFIKRRLPKDFIVAIDEWIQNSISVSKEVLGDSWLDLYLTSPVWMFAFQSTVCGDGAWVGIMMPSVDKVGRYFPLILACKIEEEKALGLVLTENSAWFAKLEEVALAGLDEEYSLEQFNDAVLAIGEPIVKKMIQPEGVELEVGEGEEVTHLISEGLFDGDAIASSDALLLATLDSMDLTHSDGLSLWMRIAEDNKGAVSIYKGLPTAYDYVKMIA